MARPQTHAKQIQNYWETNGFCRVRAACTQNGLDPFRPARGATRVIQKPLNTIGKSIFWAVARKIQHLLGCQNYENHWKIKPGEGVAKKRRREFSGNGSANRNARHVVWAAPAQQVS